MGSTAEQLLFRGAPPSDLPPPPKGVPSFIFMALSQVNRSETQLSLFGKSFLIDGLCKGSCSPRASVSVQVWQVVVQAVPGAIQVHVLGARQDRCPRGIPCPLRVCEGCRGLSRLQALHIRSQDPLHTLKMTGDPTEPMFLWLCILIFAVAKTHLQNTYSSIKRRINLLYVNIRTIF